MAKSSPQNYPRVTDSHNPYFSCLDESQLIVHPRKIPPTEVTRFIIAAIKNAEMKSSREILNVPDGLDNFDTSIIYKREGKTLFKYFRDYCGDPAATAYQLLNEHYTDVCVEQFRLRTLQKERMNSGWRYQFLAFECARSTGRFRSVSDIGAAEADFNAEIEFKDTTINPLSLYVSVKNRMNTLGGQDWPKAIQALEQVAINDRNRRGPYLCVFGLAMDQGKKSRTIKSNSRTKQPYSVNTEVWLANFFWPFFANYSYEEIMSFVLEVLLKTTKDKLSIKVVVPEELIESFGNCCREHGLISDDGKFNNPRKLVEFFCKR
ncbi:MAG: hypothetical protein GX577_11685 [Leptolinea sp.]|nr:hypothetical protein [Leptolinea sp.]